MNVNELISVLDAWFGDSHVHSRAVLWVDGRVVHKDFDVCTKAGSSRIVRNFVSQRVVPRGEGVSARARRRVFAFLVEGSSALGSVALHVFAPIAVVADGYACWKAELCTIGVLETGSWRNPVKHLVRWRCREQPGVCCWLQVSGGFVDAGECEGALRGCCGSESCQVLVSSPASRLMAWSLDRVDLNPGISAVRSSMPPNPILAVTLAAHEAQLTIVAGSD